MLRLATVVIVTAGWWVAVPTPCRAADPTLITTRLGTLVGTHDTAGSGSYHWKGVPFAKPPTGALRWRAPVAPVAWAGTRSAREFANACVQVGRIYGPGANNRFDRTIATTLGQAVGSEDCLYLNIWRPASSDSRLPVIVFLHGGSNVSGYTADPLYDGTALAVAARAVVVTVNYRLGIFGWLDLPALKSGSLASRDGDSGNFALLDQIQALRFVARHIDRFGGDPGNVSLMGQSAGAIDACALLTSPRVALSRPRLFHKLIALSGGLSPAWELPPGSLPTLEPEALALAQGEALLLQQLLADGTATGPVSAQAWVLARTPRQIADYLRGKSAAALLATLETRLTPLALAGSGPIPEGRVVASDPIAAIRSGRYLQVPVLAGNTRDEAKLFPDLLALSPWSGGSSGRRVSDGVLFETQFDQQPDAPPTVTLAQWIAPAYLPVAAPITGFNAASDWIGRIFFGASRDSLLDALATQQPRRTWHYRFDWDREPAPWNDIYGAAHLFDLPFIFGNFGPSLFGNVISSTANRPGRLALSAAMTSSIAAFVRTGDPNDAALGVRWPVWPGRLVFDASLDGAIVSPR